MTRYLDPRICAHDPALGELYARSVGATWDEVGVPCERLAYGDAVVTGPFSALEWAWLPSHIAVEIVPDGGTLKREPVMRALLHAAGLAVKYAESPPKTARSRDWEAYHECLERAEQLAQLPCFASHVTVGATVAPHSVVSDTVKAREILSLLHSRPYSFDFETNSLDPYRVSRRSLAFADERDSWYFVPAVVEECRDEISRLLVECPSRASNVKYDAEVWATWTGRRPMELALCKDTQIGDALLRPDALMHGLKSITKFHLKRDVLELDDLGGPEHFWELPYETQAVYAAAGDARNSYDLVDHIWPRLAGRGLDRYYERLEAPCIPVLAEMELSGLPLDRRALLDLACEYDARGRAVRAELLSLGFTGRPNADADIRAFLHDELHLPVLVRTPKLRAPSVALDVLYRLQLVLRSEPRDVARELRAVQLFIEWSAIDKALSTFLEPPLASGEWTFWFDILQTSVKTGRLSTKPNAQNWPPAIRAVCAAREGWELTDADYAQVEPRVAAHLSQDTRMLRDFREGRDVYISLAADMGLGVIPSHSPIRKNVKTIYLADQYGTSPPKMQMIALKQDNYLPLSTCRELQQGIHSARREFYAWRERRVEQAKRDGYVEDPLFGRIRDVSRGLYHVDPGVRDAAAREVMNWPMQCGAGGIIKLAMPGVQRLCREAGGTLINQIHDELLAHHPVLSERARREFNEELERRMTGVVELAVPLLAEVGWGHTWKEAKGE